MAAHRKPSRRTLGGGPTRTAATLALAGAATATGFEGTGQADPQLSPEQVASRVDTLYQEAEAATEKYNGAKEKAEAARQRLNRLQDAMARKQERLNAAREALGSVATAQYRGGGLDPALQLALSDDPGRYLEGAEFAERAGHRQTATVNRVRRQLGEIERLRGAARIEVASLTSRQAELHRHKRTVTGKLAAARRLLSRLTDGERARLAGQQPTARAARSSAAGRASLPAPGSATAQAPNSRAAAAVSYAFQKLGSPYVWGATGPDAFDCSGLVQAAYRSAGVSLPRTTYAQIGAGRRVARSELLPGDLVFFYSGISHVGIYVGGGRMIHAPNPSAPVRLAPLDEMPFAGATRVV
ncbi:NlpC/P60 family protein [Streptomyces sp. NPDC052682]|uniref:C40 family peptidase n=1 Tax=Streptomyces sp. NPDC052682 TaxID=3154954 RepID=UPI00342B4C83